MAANEETVSIDTVNKRLWDNIAALGAAIGEDALEALLGLIDGGGEPAVTPYDVSAIIDTDSGGKKRITFDKTAEEMYEALTTGVLMHLTSEVTGATVNSYTHVNLVKLTVEGGAIVYQFYFVSDKHYMSENLSGDDTVVVTEA